MKIHLPLCRFGTKCLMLGVLASLGLTGCIIPTIQRVPNPDTPRHIATSGSTHRIEVFFDGTKNKWDSRTNVRRRFEMVAALEDPHFKCFYVDGVGNDSLTAAALGIGMKQRVVEGYEFLSAHWRPGTKVRIYGFSRGALQARMLAGMMAHSGLPLAGNLDRSLQSDIAEEVWKFSRDHLKDIPSKNAGEWNRALAENRRLMAEHIRGRFGGEIRFANPDIEFMGLWDTVPGLTIGELKNNGDLSEGGGTRYKVRPYPNTRVIAHALALDEHRNKFAPLLVGGPLDPTRTIVHEVWFPGAHSDVGGGYSDSNDMAGVTYNWVHELLHRHKVVSRETVAYSDATSILHHPEAGRIYDFVGGKNRRVIPKYSVIDRTVFIRANAHLPLEESGSGYKGVPYRPVLTLDDGSTVAITPTKDPATALGPFLILNDSRKSAGQQKSVRKIIDPSQLQIQMAVDPNPTPAADGPPASNPPAQRP